MSANLFPASSSTSRPDPPQPKPFSKAEVPQVEPRQILNSQSYYDSNFWHKAITEFQIDALITMQDTTPFTFVDPTKTECEVFSQSSVQILLHGQETDIISWTNAIQDFDRILSRLPSEQNLGQALKALGNSYGNKKVYFVADGPCWPGDACTYERLFWHRELRNPIFRNHLTGIYVVDEPVRSKIRINYQDDSKRQFLLQKKFFIFELSNEQDTSQYVYKPFSWRDKSILSFDFDRCSLILDIVTDSQEHLNVVDYLREKNISFEHDLPMLQLHGYVVKI